jgi:hypothetical protein
MKAFAAAVGAWLPLIGFAVGVFGYLLVSVLYGWPKRGGS